ncbi:3-hydroxy-3-isohexenylglutaryl-CoA/hydroxy-methylglutaryl-CoA lyase [Nymphon striatum]|nr:3-hydroxy-3-isohexenylglutaryl-CoA/hydroxy-methylglutaryl-CoA lyase [Nymphon striatum]
MSLGPCEIFEVGPRDGLQNETKEIAVAQKVALVNKLTEAGFRRIECASFVSPKWVPQMAGSGEVMAAITRKDGVRYAALTPNMRGYEDALAANVDEIAIFGSASEGFSQKNINVSIAESLEMFAPVLEDARHRDIPVRGYVSCVVECPYDGAIAPAAVAEVGGQAISLGDTIGAGTPDSIARMLLAVRDVVPAGRLAGHYHDTKGHAMANIDASLSLGLRVFDGAVGGLGGCPYAPGAPGKCGNRSGECASDGAGLCDGAGSGGAGRGRGNGAC